LIHDGGTARSSSTEETKSLPSSLASGPERLDYRLIKELWAFTGNRIAVRFVYEWHDDSGHWYRSYGNENWEFGEDGPMIFRFASINDLPILESDRKYHWPLGPRPDGHPGLSDLGL
jgi:nuclear transport factor 2 (NTF2) superfamily protein